MGMKIGGKVIVVAIDINSPREVVRRAAEVAEHYIDAYVMLVTVIDIPSIAGAEVSPLSTDIHEKRISEYHKSLIQEYFSGMPNILVESKILYGE